MTFLHVRQISNIHGKSLRILRYSLSIILASLANGAILPLLIYQMVSHISNLLYAMSATSLLTLKSESNLAYYFVSLSSNSFTSVKLISKIVSLAFPVNDKNTVSLASQVWCKRPTPRTSYLYMKLHNSQVQDIAKILGSHLPYLFSTIICHFFILRTVFSYLDTTESIQII